MRGDAESVDATSSLQPVAALFGLCALVGAGLTALGVQGPLLWLTAGATLFVGAGLPLVVGLSEGRTSPLKLFLFASLLSPLVVTAVDAALRAVIGSGPGERRTCLVAVLLLVAAAQVLLRGRELERGRLGPGALASLALGALVAVWVGVVLFDGSATRVSFHGLLHSGLALATERGLPPTNPWLAGEPLGYYWAWHAVGGVTTTLLAIAPTQALALIGLWAAIGSVLALHLIASPVFRSARAELLGVVLALFGLNALGGFHALVAGEASGAPATNAELLGGLRAALVPEAGGRLLWDPRTAFGPSKFGNLSSYPAALALGLGAWAAAAHAMRHGHRTWIALTALCAGGSLVLNPLVGASTAGVLAAAAFVFGSGPRVRFALPAAVIVGALPGVWLTRSAAGAYAGSALELSLDLRHAVAAVGPWLLALPPAAVGLAAARRAIPAGDPRRAVLWTLAFGALANLAVAAAVELPYANEYKFVRLGLFPLGLLAGAVALPRLAGGLRLVAPASALPLVLGAVLCTWVGARAYLGLARVDLPLEETAAGLAPVPGDSQLATDAAAAYAFLRDDPRVRETAAVLAVDPSYERGVEYGVRRDDGGQPVGFAFTSSLNLQAHEGAAFGALDLFADRPSQVLSGANPVARRRIEALTELYRRPEPWSEGTRRLLFEHPRPLLVWVGPRERIQRSDLEESLARFGFEVVHAAGDVRLHLAPGPGAELWRAAAPAEGADG